jgi:predicted nucleotidyltransferase
VQGEHGLDHGGALSRAAGDIDFLVDFDLDSSLFDLIRVTRELKNSSGTRSTSYQPAA